MKRAIYAADIGSTRCSPGKPPNFAWARVDPDHPGGVRGSSDIAQLARSVTNDLAQGASVALGFEAPLFMPVPWSADDLCRGRSGDGSRSFAAPAGLTVAALGLHQAAWVLREIALNCGVEIVPSFDWTRWPPAGPLPTLLLWEAFVSGAAHSNSHLQDAATAALEFLAHEHDLGAANAVTAAPSLSLIAAAALWSGLTTDLTLLHLPVVVIKPLVPYNGEIDAIVEATIANGSAAHDAETLRPAHP